MNKRQHASVAARRPRARRCPGQCPPRCPVLKKLHRSAPWENRRRFGREQRHILSRHPRILLRPRRCVRHGLLRGAEQRQAWQHVSAAWTTNRACKRLRQAWRHVSAAWTTNRACKRLRHRHQRWQRRRQQRQQRRRRRKPARGCTLRQPLHGERTQMPPAQAPSSGRCSPRKRDTQSGYSVARSSARLRQRRPPLPRSGLPRQAAARLPLSATRPIASLTPSAVPPALGFRSRTLAPFANTARPCHGRAFPELPPPIPDACRAPPHHARRRLHPRRDPRPDTTARRRGTCRA